MKEIIYFVKNYINTNLKYKVAIDDPDVSDNEFRHITDKLNVFLLNKGGYSYRTTLKTFSPEKLKKLREENVPEVLFHIEKRKNYRFDRVIKNRLDDSEFIYAFCVDMGDTNFIPNYNRRFFIGFEKNIPKIFEMQYTNRKKSRKENSVIWDIDTSYDDDDRRFKLEDIGEVVEVVKFEKPEKPDHIKYWESL